MAGAAAGRAARLNAPGTPTAERLLFDALRGGGALVVFAAHAAFFWLDGSPDGAVPARLLHAADLAVIGFFVVSGYATLTSLRRRTAATADGRLDVGRFARDRVRRLLPPLAIALLVTTLCHHYLLVAGPPGYEHYWSVRSAVGTLLFLQGLSAAFDVPLANGPLWSLAHMGGFYLVGVALFERRPCALIASAVVIVVLASGATLGIWPQGWLGDTSGRWLPGFIVWCAGGTLALAVSTGRLPGLERRSLRLTVTGGLLTLIVVTAVSDTYLARYGFGLVLLALFAVWLPTLGDHAGESSPVRMSESRRSGVMWLALRSCTAVAPFSYTLYVLHYPLVLAWNVATDRWQESPEGSFATFTLGAIGIIAVCAVAGRHVESPGITRAR